MAKRNIDEVIGYIHDVTDVSTSRSNVRYFNATVQVGEEFMRMVCFSPEKHGMFTNASELKSPVKINNAAIVPSRDAGKKEIKTTKSTNLQILESHKFKRRKLEFQTTPTLQIGDLCQDRQTVTVNAKALKTVEEVELVNLYGRQTEKKEVCIADKTKCIELALWAEHINCVENDQFYRFENVQTRTFQDKIKLTTTPKTKILPIPAFSSVCDVPEDEVESSDKVSFVATVKHCTVKINNKCSSCNKPIPHNAVGNVLTKCGNCNMNQKSSDLLTSCVVQMNIEEVGKKTLHRVCIFEDTVKNFLHSVDKLSLMESSSDLEEYLLLMPPTKFKLCKDIVASFEPFQAEHI